MYYLFLISLSIMIYIVLNKFTELSFLKQLTVALCFYIVEYSTFSVVFLYMDCFDIKNILLCCLVTEILISVRLYKKSISITVDLKTVFMILLFAILLPFVSTKGETYRTGSDVGFYASKAIDLINGDRVNVKTLNEYGILSDEVDVGLDELQKLSYFDMHSNSNSDEYEYSYHSLYVWPALLALFGTIFGLDNMLIVLTFLYIMIIVNIGAIIEKINQFKYSEYSAIVLFALSPPIIYLCKMSFSELMFINVLIFGILLTLEEKDDHKLLSSFAFGLLEAIHSSAFMYIPVIFLVLYIKGIINKNRTYFKINIIMLFMFICCLWMNLSISNIYMSNILHSSLKLYSIDANMIVLLIALLSFILIIISHISIMFLNKLSLFNALEQIYNKYIIYGLKLATVLIVLYTCYQGYKLGFTDKLASGMGSWAGREFYANKGFLSLTHLNIVSIGMGLSFFGLPLIVIKLFKYNLNKENLILYIMFLYSWSIYTIIRCDTPSNYYASRYYAIFLIPIGVILIGSMVKTTKEVIIICMLSIVLCMPFNYAMKDYIAYQSSNERLNDALGIVKSNSIVLIEPNQNLVQNLMNNLREINNNSIYNLNNLQEVLCNNTEKEKYIISTQQIEYDNLFNVFEKEYVITSDIADYTNIFTIVIYPLRFQESVEMMYIYRYKQ